MEQLTIGQLAKQAHVNVETVRYYERRGLILTPPRRATGYRQYSPGAVARIRFIKRAQEVGFTLKEIQELLSLRVAPGTTCADIRQRTELKISEVGRKIRDLNTMKNALNILKSACKGRGPSSDCPILEALEANGGRYQ